MAPGDHTLIRYLPAGRAWAAAGARCVQAVSVRIWNSRGILAAVQGVDGQKRAGDIDYGVALMTATQISD